MHGWGEIYALGLANCTHKHTAPHIRENLRVDLTGPIGWLLGWRMPIGSGADVARAFVTAKLRLILVNFME